MWLPPHLRESAFPGEDSGRVLKRSGPPQPRPPSCGTGDGKLSPFDPENMMKGVLSDTRAMLEGGANHSRGSVGDEPPLSSRTITGDELDLLMQSTQHAGSQAVVSGASGEMSGLEERFLASLEKRQPQQKRDESLSRGVQAQALSPQSPGAIAAAGRNLLAQGTAESISPPRDMLTQGSMLIDDTEVDDLINWTDGLGEELGIDGEF